MIVVATETVGIIMYTCVYLQKSHNVRKLQSNVCVIVLKKK